MIWPGTKKIVLFFILYIHMRKRTLKWLMAAILLAIIVAAIFIFTDRTTVNVSITKTPVVTGKVLTAVVANPYDICYIPIA